MLTKICGIKDKISALAAAKAGADFLGFNFAPTSKRLIAASRALKIIESLPKKHRPVCVAVFMDQSKSDIKAVMSKVRVDMLQFHGKENPKFCAQFGLPYIKAFGVGKKRAVSLLAKKMRKYKAKYFLLDREDRGRGKIIDLKIVRQLAKKFPVMLSGGLTPENAASCAAKAGPIKGVDVAGGVEENGKKRVKKIRLFIHNAI